MTYRQFPLTIVQVNPSKILESVASVVMSLGFSYQRSLFLTSIGSGLNMCAVRQLRSIKPRMDVSLSH
jgi:hypothetical protein